MNRFNFIKFLKPLLFSSKLNLLFLIFLINIFNISSTRASRSPTLISLKKLFASYREPLENDYCLVNIYRFVAYLKNQGIDLSTYNVLVLRAPINRYISGFQVKPFNLSGWYYHVVFQADGHIFDFDFSHRGDQGEPTPVPVDSYFMEMFLNLPDDPTHEHAAAFRDFLLAHRDIKIISIPANQYLGDQLNFFRENKFVVSSDLKMRFHNVFTFRPTQHGEPIQDFLDRHQRTIRQGLTRQTGSFSCTAQLETLFDDL